MTKFHVDLGDNYLHTPAPGAREFADFKSLKKAVRWARAEHAAGNFETLPNILNDDGDPITIYWDSPQWLTRSELEERLNSSEKSAETHRNIADKMREEAAARDNALIHAGLIPVRALAPHLVDVVLARDGGNASNLFPRDFAAAAETTYRLEFRQFATRVGKEQHPFITAMQAITDRLTNR